jgi:dTDP-4-amino-4,6-dideoxygalactose transaminase
MTDIHAAIGREQLKKLPRFTEKRIINANFLTEHLQTAFTPKVPEGFVHVFHQYTVRIVGSRDLVCSQLEVEGIGTGIYYPAGVHKLPSYKAKKVLPKTDAAAQEVLSLPVHPGLSSRQLKKVVEAFNKIQDSVSAN